MELSKKVVFFCCCFCVYIGFIGLHNWNKEKKVMEQEEPIPMGCFEVKEIKGGKHAHAEILYNMIIRNSPFRYIICAQT